MTLRGIVLFFQFIIMMLITTVSCGAEEKEQELEEYFSGWEKTTYIEIQDVTENFYAAALKEELSEEEVASFLEKRKDFELAESDTGSRPYYKLLLFDENRKVLDGLTVNTAYNIICDSGLRIKKNNAVSEWLEEVEKNHNIDYQLFERAPGESFLSLLGEIQGGELSEKTENPFIDGIEYTLSDEEVRAFALLEKDIQMGARRTDVEWLFQINFYSENGSSLYRMLASENGKLYTDSGYELQGASIEKWWKDTLNEARKFSENNKE